MKLPRFFVFLFITTIISLLYVQMQVKIFKLAYECRAKETRLKDLLDARCILVYNINKSESAQNLGHKVLCAQTDLQFTDNDQIASLRLPTRLAKSLKINSSNLNSRTSNFFVNLFSLKSQAEATEKIK